MIRPNVPSTSLLALLASVSDPLAAQANAPAAPVQSANRAALREPLTANYLNAIQVYPYAQGNLYRLYAAPERITDISLQPGETVTSVAAGDTVRWTVGDTTSGSGENRRTHILVKPFSAGLRTNLVITTDRRAYRLELESRASAPMAAIAWTYPEDALLALRRQAQAVADVPVATPVAVDRLNFSYEIGGDRPHWRPVRAFDDGRQTFVEFPPGIEVGEVPPIFVIGDSGDAELVNFRLRGRYYVVDRLFERAELRLGGRRQQVVRIEREAGRRTRQGRGS